MRRTVIYTVAVFILCTLSVKSQNNFKIGLDNAYFTNTTPNGPGLVTSIMNPNAPAYYSSMLGIFKEDGINLIQDFIPNESTTYQQFRDYASLCENHGMQLIDNLLQWYKPDINSNVYSGLPCSPNIPYVNYDNNLFQNVYAVRPNAFFGHGLGAEKYANHPYMISTTCSSTDTLCRQIPPQNSSDATAYFKNKRDLYFPGQKIICVEAAHGGMITDNFSSTFGLYEPQDYIHLNNVSNPTLGDVFVEASYFSYEFKWWWNTANASPNQDYRGKFGSIDYARSKGYSKIFAENNVEVGGNFGTQYHIHSNPAVPNANLMRFYAYTSFIHKAHGIMFYHYWFTYDQNNSTDVASQVYMSDPNHTDRYTRPYMSVLYNTHLCKFTRELRYLVNNNYLSDDDSQVLYEKTTSADVNGILPASTVYLPAVYQAADARDYNTVNGYGSININNPIYRDEGHGLRYIIRTNGTEAVMIISNPNPFSLHNVPLNFSGITNSQIANANYVDVLFEDGSVTDVNSMSYKTDPITPVNPVTFSLNKVYSFPFCNKSFTAEFGPFDTHVYHFRTTNTPLISYQNGWNQVWTNNYSGTIGSWGPQIASGDKFVAFDYDGDGDDELLCCENLPANSKFSILHYGNNTWSSTPAFTNNGSGYIASSSAWTILPNDKFFAADFDGDGKKNELLCIQSVGTTLKAVIFKRVFTKSGGLYVYWTNNANGWLNSSGPSGWSISSTDKFQVGDFDGDGKKNDLLCVQRTGGGWAVLHYNTGTNNFVWLAGNTSGTFQNAATWTIGITDQFYVNDYNGDGTCNEVLCVNRGTGISSVVVYNAGAWSLRWTNGGNNTIGNWNLSLNDVLVTGDIDTDVKAELLFVQACGDNCKLAMSEDFDSSNQPVQRWSNSSANGPNGPAPNFIDTWRVNDADVVNPRYMLIQPELNNKSYLLAFKDYVCNNTLNALISMYKPNYTSYNYKIFGDATGQPPLSQIIKVIRIFPNPAENLFTLESGQLITNCIVETFNTMGQSVFKKEYAKLNSEQVDISGLCKGVYFVHITGDGVNEIHKVIKE